MMVPSLLTEPPEPRETLARSLLGWLCVIALGLMAGAAAAVVLG